jgi:hypothetical protein
VALALAVLEVVTMEVSGKGGGDEDDGGTWRRLNVIFKDMTASLSYYVRYLDNILYNTRPLDAQ